VGAGVLVHVPAGRVAWTWTAVRRQLEQDRRDGLAVHPDDEDLARELRAAAIDARASTVTADSAPAPVAAIADVPTADVAAAWHLSAKQAERRMRRAGVMPTRMVGTSWMWPADVVRVPSGT